MGSAKRLTAVLFDFDGTLVDTEPYWMQGEIELLGQWGVPWDLERASQLCGTSREYSQGVLLDQMASHGVDVEAIDADEFYGRLCQMVIDQMGLFGAKWMPGVKALIDDLAEHGLPCAVVSASPPEVLAAGLADFPPGVISVVVDGQMVRQSKPAPDGYLLAAARLGVEAADCVVIEDTVSGAAAGRAAGAVVVAVPGQHHLPDEPGQVVLASLDGVDTAYLSQLYAEVRAAL